MTNLEYYQNEIKKNGLGGFSFSNGEIGDCMDTDCKMCDFSDSMQIRCHNRKVDWLLKEHEE